MTKEIFDKLMNELLTHYPKCLISLMPKYDSDDTCYFSIGNGETHTIQYISIPVWGCLPTEKYIIYLKK